LHRAIAQEGRMSRYLRVLSLILFAAATLRVAAQQPGSAGATRPKLEVLQSLPEAQLFPLMNLLSQSLGVRCDYCHVQATPDLSRTPSNAGGWAWDRDDKPQKQRAREMMKMVVALNTSQFKGETQVTCYTCHRGATQPSRLPLLPPPAPGSARTLPPTPLPSADRVWAAYVSAVGRVDAAAPDTGTSVRGWDERPEGRYGKFDITVAGSDRYRLVLTTPEGTTKQGLDGEAAWVATTDRVQQLSSPADIARIRRIAMRYRAVKEPPPNMRIVGIERVEDRDAYVLQGRFDSVTTQRSYFDVVTGLLRREITTTETLLLPLEEQVDYDEYRDVNGVQMPFRIRISDGASYSTTTRTILEIGRNVPVDDSLFRPPATPGKG
jgi:photosynthetic reaction center cytochrome c subunit